MSSMKWEELTANGFARAVRKARGVCVVPIGCLERHGSHLPLGTDTFQVCAVAEAAVAQEPAVLFPAHFLSQIHEAKHYPGAVALPGRLMTELLEAICDEIARNGLNKIVLLNGHGGNESWLSYAAWMMAHDPRHAFTVYVARLEDYWYRTPRYDQLRGRGRDGHGGVKETSLLLHLRPELVRMREIEKPGVPLGRLQNLPLYSPHGWYANYPRQYAGDGRLGSAEKGAVLLDELAASVAKIIRAVKRDTMAPRLRREFLRRIEHAPLRRRFGSGKGSAK